MICMNFQLQILLFCTESFKNCTDRPTIKLLNKNVRDKIAASSMWEDVGVELLNEKQRVMSKIIKKNNHTDVQMCCTTQMLMYWLEVDTEASWNKLIEALKGIRQHSLAVCIIKDILKGFGSHIAI